MRNISGYRTASQHCKGAQEWVYRLSTCLHVEMNSLTSLHLTQVIHQQGSLKQLSFSAASNLLQCSLCSKMVSQQ